MNKSYLAGIIDAEGCFSIKKRGNYYLPSFKIEMKERTILDHIANLVSVNIHQSKKKTYFIDLSCTKALLLVNYIIDDLILKKAEAKLLQQLKLSKDKYTLFLQCKRLKKSNIDLPNIKEENFIPYLAGLMDGDGSISIVKGKVYKNKQYYEARISLEMASENLIRQIATKLDRPIWIREHLNPNHRTNYIVSIPKTSNILKELEKYCLLKKTKLQTILLNDFQS